MVHHTPPKNFNPRFEVVSCCLEFNGRILLLERHDDKSQGGKWGVPAGKIDFGEVPLEAMVREMREETGILLLPSDFEFLKKVFVRYPDYDFVFHMFRAKLPSQPSVTISSKEHKQFLWMNPRESLSMNLVKDLDECIKMFY